MTRKVATLATRGPMTLSIRLLDAGDVAVLTRVAPDVFDNDLDPERTREFLRDPRHHLAVALDNDMVVGFASGVHYVHPDKPPELWINEVGVAPTHRRQRIGQQVLRALFDRGRELGCREAWVLTDRPNEAAMRFYGSLAEAEAATDHVMFTFRLDLALND